MICHCVMPTRNAGRHPVTSQGRSALKREESRKTPDRLDRIADAITCRIIQGFLITGISYEQGDTLHEIKLSP